MSTGRVSFTVVAGGSIAEAAATTAKTIMAIVAVGTQEVPKLSEWGLWVADGTGSAEKNHLVEIGYTDGTTQGTSTAVTAQRDSGRGTTVRSSGAKNFTAEPTAITVLREYPLDPNKGWTGDKYPLGEEPELPTGGTNAALWVVRLTVPSGGTAYNLRGYMKGIE